MKKYMLGIIAFLSFGLYGSDRSEGQQGGFSYLQISTEVVDDRTNPLARSGTPTNPLACPGTPTNPNGITVAQLQALDLTAQDGDQGPVFESGFIGIQQRPVQGEENNQDPRALCCSCLECLREHVNRRYALEDVYWCYNPNNPAHQAMDRKCAFPLICWYVDMFKECCYLGPEDDPCNRCATTTLSLACLALTGGAAFGFTAYAAPAIYNAMH